MKNLITLVILACSILFATAAHTAEALSETDALKKQLDKVQDLQSRHALIKNKADLSYYESITYPEFPLNAFSNKHIRQDFIDGLRFSDKGLIRFNTDIIETLDYEDAYKVLALFGQSYLAEHIVSADNDGKSLPKKPYLSNAEYPLLAQLRAIDNRDDSEVSDLDRMADFRGFYDNILTPALTEKNCLQRGHHETLAVLQMLYTINFYRNDSDIADHHLACFNDYVSQFPKSKYIPAVATDVYQSLLSSRQLTAAQQLHRQYPDMAVGDLPSIQSQEIKGPSVYRIAADESGLIQQDFTFKTETEVIVIAHPYCQFCQLLIKDIVADENLSKFFKQHSRWIASENYLDHIDAIIDWNKKYPMARLDIAYLKQDFNQLDEWGTPAIYFLKDGQVLDKLIGWPQQGRKQDLMAYIDKYFANDQ